MTRLIVLLGLLLAVPCFADEPLPQAKTLVRDRMELLGLSIEEQGREIIVYFAYGTQDAQGKFVATAPPQTLTMQDLVEWEAETQLAVLVGGGMSLQQAQRQAVKDAQQTVKTFLQTLQPDFVSIRGKVMQYLKDKTLLPKITQKYAP